MGGSREVVVKRKKNKSISHLAHRTASLLNVLYTVFFEISRIDGPRLPKRSSQYLQKMETSIETPYPTPATLDENGFEELKRFQRLKEKVERMLNKNEIAVLGAFERYLQTSYVVSSPFQEIITGNLDRKGKLWQFFWWMMEVFYITPHYGFICLVYRSICSTLHKLRAS